MTLAIMQPYLFPYLGYFHLIHAIDKFVFYDDVNFIKQGWINRNSILLNQEPHLFTVPVRQISSFKKINETELDSARYLSWKKRFFKTIDHAYRNAPYFNSTRRLIEDVFSEDTKYVSDLAILSILSVSKYLNLRRDMILTAQIYANAHLQADDRVLDICKREGATVYVNPRGGKDLYSREVFAANGIDLKFISSDIPRYRQFGGEFVAELSIIDVLMFNSPEVISQEMLSCYVLE